MLDRPGGYEPNPEEKQKAERRHYFRQLLDNGQAPQTLGYHGTSLYTLRQIIQTGTLTPSTQEQIAGRIYFYPIREQFPDSKFQEDLFTREEALEEARIYAQIADQAHEFLIQLGLPFSPDTLYAAKTILADPIHPEAVDLKAKLIAEYHANPSLFQPIIHDVKNSGAFKGIVLGISPHARKTIKIEEGDPGEPDLRLVVPKGLDYRFLDGLTIQESDRVRINHLLDS